MYLVKTQSGSYSPFDDSDYEESKKIKAGEVVKAVAPRNYGYHKKGMALLNLGFNNQDKVTLFEPYRKMMTIKAGYYDEVMDKNGKPYYLPQSLSYENMSAEKFNKWYEDTLQVIAHDLDTAREEIISALAGFA